MGNAEKTTIHIPKLSVGQYLFLFDIGYFLKILLTYSKFLKYKRTLSCQKARNTKEIENKI